jgi:phage FluMu protein Com
VTLAEHRCTDCGRLLFKGSGAARVELRCKCGRLVTVTLATK